MFVVCLLLPQTEGRELAKCGKGKNRLILHEFGLKALKKEHTPYYSFYVQILVQKVLFFTKVLISK